MHALVQPDFLLEEAVHTVGYQSWTKDNLSVNSEHEGIQYNTTRWDALCPYIDVTEDMLQMAPKPFVVYAIPPTSRYGVPIKDRYGLVNALNPEFWAETPIAHGSLKSSISNLKPLRLV